VLRESLVQLRLWDEQGDAPDLQLAVNLSGRQLVEPGLVQEVSDALEDVGVGPERLVLEITESVLVADVAPVHNAIRALKDSGVRLSIDDFGTGHSSLTYLRRLPVDVVKVDRSFVSGMTGEGDDDIIVAAVVSLAHNLGLTAVAEGIETVEQLVRLQELGCDIGQGYLFGRPQPPQAIAALLAEGIGDRHVTVDVDAPGLGSLRAW
jgi:EAL domain-containing protein (putative c-di-GMP-specific phosphodiesterase class I)